MARIGTCELVLLVARPVPVCGETAVALVRGEAVVVVVPVVVPVAEPVAVPVDHLGRVDPDAFGAALGPDTALACLIAASHEVGTTQPVEEVATRCAEAGVPLLVDAAQVVGRAPVPPGWSALTASARKWSGPPGVGVLAVRTGVRFAPGWTSWLPLAWAPYWVIAVDPEYRWAMVGGPDRDHLWILSRESTLAPDRYSALVEQARGLGYPVDQLVVANPADGMEATASR